MFRRFPGILLIPILIVCMGVPVLCKSKQDPQAILEKVDLYRGYEDSFQMDVTVTAYSGDSLKSKLKLRTFVKNRGSSYLQYIHPPIDKGKMLLMVNENIWFYNKKISKPLRLSPRQRLLGNVSNADVARANFSFDYSPSIKGYKIVSKTPCIVLELHAKSTKVAYGKIILYVSRKNFKPIKSEFYASSGRLLKTGYYVSYKVFGKHEKLVKINIIDAVMKNNRTTIEYLNYKLKKLPNRYYNPDFLPRIR